MQIISVNGTLVGDIKTTTTGNIIQDSFYQSLVTFEKKLHHRCLDIVLNNFLTSNNVDLVKLHSYHQARSSGFFSYKDGGNIWLTTQIRKAAPLCEVGGGMKIIMQFSVANVASNFFQMKTNLPVRIYVIKTTGISFRT